MGKWEKNMKEAKVAPLYKNGPHEDVNNYRPISILPVLSKVLEKHVHESLSNFLHHYKLLHKTQSGFRAQHSCETALVNMIDLWLNAIDKSKMVGVVLVDFKKAFDLVDHQILINKLEIYGIKDDALMWFDTYLTNRKQQVTINNSKSDFQYISCGVPQGSILGPLLFLLFINDLPLYTNNVFTDLYADDTTLYDVQDSMEQIENNLQSALNNLHIWCRGNGIILNSSKTKVMLVTTNQKRQKLINDNLALKFNNESLHTISGDKILGVFVDNNLTWSIHIKHLTKKIASSVWLLSKIKKFLSQDHRIQFYKSYIQPHIDFCNIVWGSSSESNKHKIFKLQKRACKVILDYNVDDPNSAMNSLKIMSVYDRLYLRKAKFMFKIYNNVAPAYITENFTLRNKVNTSINLRSSSAGCFIPPKPRTEYFKHSMRYSGCLVWNSLPEEVKSAQTIDTFHDRCLKWLVNWNYNSVLHCILHVHLCRQFYSFIYLFVVFFFVFFFCFCLFFNLSKVKFISILYIACAHFFFILFIFFFVSIHKLKDQQRRSRPGGSESALFAGAGHVQVQQGQGGTLCGYGEGKVKKKKKKKQK